MHEDILERLYRQYYSAALLYALSLCRDRHLAEELVQEAFVRAYLSLGDDAPSFPFWLMKVCRNLYYDHARRQKYLSAAPIPEQADTATPESALLAKEETAALFRAVQKLDSIDRYQQEGYDSGDDALARLDDSIEVAASVSFNRTLTLEEVLALRETYKGEVDVYSAVLDWRQQRPLQLSLTGGAIGWGEALLSLYESGVVGDIWGMDAYIDL